MVANFLPKNWVKNSHEFSDPSWGKSSVRQISIIEWTASFEKALIKHGLFFLYGTIPIGYREWLLF